VKLFIDFKGEQDVAYCWGESISNSLSVAFPRPLLLY